jgi:APA family basic amino acid/polyamine antiporter
MLVAGSMIGSGIFIVSAEIARDVGSPGWLMLVWLVTGLMTVIGALSYAELAAMMPQAGGQYIYLREAYSPLWGFLYGWTLFLVIQTGTIAAVGVAFAKFLGVLVPLLGTDPKAGAMVLFEAGSFTITAGQGIAVGIIVLLTAVNCLGVQEGKWVQNIFTVAKTLALILLIILGLTVARNADAVRLNTADWWGGAMETGKFEEVQKKVANFLPLGGFAVILMVAGGAMVGSLFSADSWHNVTFTAGEVRNPRRNLPLSLILGAGGVIVLYLLANVAYLSSLPMNGSPSLHSKIQTLDFMISEMKKLGKDTAAEDLTRERTEVLAKASSFERGVAYAKEDRVGTAVMDIVWPGKGAPLMAIAIMLSTFGCANGLILMGARLYYAMARDGLFFQSVGRLNRFGVPAVGLVLQGIWASLLVFSGTYGQLLDYVIFAALLFYAITVLGLFVLRRKRPDAERPYRAVGYPLLPALYVFLCAIIMLDLLVVKPVYTWPGLLIVLTGVPVYFLWKARSKTV